MRTLPTFFNTADLDGFDALTAALQDRRPHPTQAALRQVGAAVMTEILDLVLGTALEDQVSPLCEAVIGGLHSAVHRLDREADRLREEMARLLRDFDGSEVADTDLQEAKARADAVDVRGDCRRRRAGDLIFPLAAQPLVELCLSIPVEVLAGAVQDRAFARQALAARIPELIRQRRSKGSLTSYFSRLVATSRDTLLPFLGDGCLAHAGVLDRSAVEGALNPEQLIWSGSPNDVLVAAATEAWVRYWQSRAPDSPKAGRR
jgi:hypothetical protein